MSDSTHDPRNSAGEIRLPSRVVVTLRAGAVFALANIICVVIFSWAWIHVRRDAKTINVTGSAKKAILADLVQWQAKVTVSDPSLEAAYAKLKGDTQKVVDFLKSKGIDEKQIIVSAVGTAKHRERDFKGNELEKIVAWELWQNVEVASRDVDRVSSAARSVTDLISQGVVLESEPPAYLYTKLADLKVEMLASATKDAAARAQQIAGNSGCRLGPVVEARMGVMQINPANSNEVSDSGKNDTTSLEKEITAVVNARFTVE